jgi:hypothetical protein
VAEHPVGHRIEPSGVFLGQPGERALVHVALLYGGAAPKGGRCGRIKERPMNYRPVEKWGALPEGMSFVEATSVAVDGNDDVYVFNRGTHPVIVFDRAGRFKRHHGRPRRHALAHRRSAPHDSTVHHRRSMLAHHR